MPFLDLPIITYHQIYKHSAPVCASRCALPVTQFELQMGYLYKHGYKCLQLIELIKPLTPKDSRPQKGFVLTFDDGFLDFRMEALPILSRYGFTATVFIVTDRVGKESNWGEVVGFPLMNWEQIRELSQHGISFGSHTCTHPLLTHLPDEQIRVELVRSKERLEKELNQEIELLAYPFGESDDKIQKIALEVGYKAACGVKRGKRGRFNLRRFIPYGDENLTIFSFKLTPWYRSIIYMREDSVIGKSLRWVKHRISATKNKSVMADKR